jgi:hypothetical protein
MSKDVRNAADLGQDLEQQVLALALAKGGEEDLGGGVGGQRLFQSHLLFLPGRVETGSLSSQRKKAQQEGEPHHDQRPHLLEKKDR